MHENPAAGICDLPEQYRILNVQGGIQRQFIEDHRRHSAYLAKTLPQEQNKDVGRYPTDSPEEFVRLFKQSPKLQQDITLELLTFLKEIEKTRMVNGKRLYDHQYAQLIWLTQSLCKGETSPETFLIQGSGGIGKTIILGVIAAVLIRLQIRGAIEARIAACATRSFVLMQQLFSKYQITEHAMHEDRNDMSTKDCSDVFQYATQLTGGRCFFEKKIITELCNASVSAEQAEQRLLEHLGSGIGDLRRQCSGRTGGAPAWKCILQKLSLVIANRRLLIMAPDGRNFEEIELTEATHKGKAKSGDLGFGIPEEYRKHDLVLAKRGADLDGKEYKRETDPKRLKADGRYRLLLILKSTLTNKAQRDTVSHLIGGIQALLVDEVEKTPGNEYQGLILRERTSKARGSDLPVPLVFGLTTEYFGKQGSFSTMRPHFDRQAPRPPLRIAINSTERILPPVSPDRPNAIDISPDSPEGLAYLVRDHFTDLPLLKRMKHPQPWRNNGVIVVHPNNVESCTMLLRDEYARRKEVTADVHSLNVNNKQPYVGRILSLMHGEERNHPCVLVTSPLLVKLALDLQGLWFLTIGTDYGIKGPNDLLRFLDRLEHSSLHRSVPNFRCLLRHPFFRTGDPRLSLFNVLEHDEPVQGVHEISWLRGQALLGKQRYRADKAFIEKNHLEGNAETVIIGNEPKEKKPRKPRAFRKLFSRGETEEEPGDVTADEMVADETVSNEVPLIGKPGQSASTAAEFLQEIGDWEFLPRKFRKWEEDWSPLFLMRQ